MFRLLTKSFGPEILLHELLLLQYFHCIILITLSPPDEVDLGKGTSADYLNLVEVLRANKFAWVH